MTYILSDLFNGKDEFFSLFERFGNQAIHKEERNNDEELTSNHEEVNRDSKEKHMLLYGIAEKVRTHQRLGSNEMKQIIVELCKDCYLTSREITETTNRNMVSISRYLCELVKEGKLELKYPGSLNSKYQVYKTYK